MCWFRENRNFWTHKLHVRCYFVTFEFPAGWWSNGHFYTIFLTREVKTFCVFLSSAQRQNGRESICSSHKQQRSENLQLLSAERSYCQKLRCWCGYMGPQDDKVRTLVPVIQHPDRKLLKLRCKVRQLSNSLRSHTWCCWDKLESMSSGWQPSSSTRYGFINFTVERQKCSQPKIRPDIRFMLIHLITPRKLITSEPRPTVWLSSLICSFKWTHNIIYMWIRHLVTQRGEESYLCIFSEC